MLIFFLLVAAGAVTGSKGGSYESPSHDRLVYVTTCLIGHQVEVQLKNGSIYNGIFHVTNTDKDFGMFCCIYFYWFLSYSRLLFWTIISFRNILLFPIFGDFWNLSYFNKTLFRSYCLIGIWLGRSKIDSCSCFHNWFYRS